MAADWRMIVLDSKAIAAGELEKIRAEAARYFVSHDPGPGLAVFTRRAKAGGCEIYFSPGSEVYAEFILETHSAATTRAPALLGTTLLVGYPQAVGGLLGKASSVEALSATSRQSKKTADAAGKHAFLRIKSD
jgi:hypothetical protein